MKVKISKYRIECIREETDPKFYGIQAAKGESNFLHFLKTYLNNEIKNHGWLVKDGDVTTLIPYIPHFIKKRMAKDGHLVDDMQQYLRSKKPFFYNKDKKNYCLAILNNHWAINGIEKDWNEGKAVLTIEWLEYTK